MAAEGSHAIEPSLQAMTVLFGLNNLRSGMGRRTRTITSIAFQNVAFSDVFSDEQDGGLDFDSRAIPLNDLRVLRTSILAQSLPDGDSIAEAAA
jgi:hypothetical protein